MAEVRFFINVGISLESTNRDEMTGAENGAGLELCPAFTGSATDVHCSAMAITW